MRGREGGVNLSREVAGFYITLIYDYVDAYMNNQTAAR